MSTTQTCFVTRALRHLSRATHQLPARCREIEAGQTFTVSIGFGQ